MKGVSECGALQHAKADFGKTMCRRCLTRVSAYGDGLSALPNKSTCVQTNGPEKGHTSKYLVMTPHLALVTLDHQPQVGLGPADAQHLLHPNVVLHEQRARGGILSIVPGRFISAYFLPSLQSASEGGARYH